MSGVAITGIGVVSGFGIGTDAFWDGLLANRAVCILADGAPAVVRVPTLDARDWVTTPGGRRIDHASLLALAATRLALADARLSSAALDPARTGLVLGSAFGNLGETPPFLDRVFTKGGGNPLLFPNMVMNAALAYVSIELGMTGPSAMLSEAEASGEAAIAWGAQLVADGEVDVCLAGAADEVTDALMAVLGRAGRLTHGTPRPLDRGADGRAVGEGAAILVLEPAARARARGASVIAEIAPHPGFAVPAPVHGWPRAPDLVARGLRPLLQDADVVVAAASGVPTFDRLEAAVLERALGGRHVAVTAPRGAVGDFGAAGALAVAVAALALQDGRVPPTVGCRRPCTDGLDVVCGAPRAIAARVAVVDGMARGGVCRPLRLTRAEPDAP